MTRLWWVTLSSLAAGVGCDGCDNTIIADQPVPDASSSAGAGGVGPTTASTGGSGASGGMGGQGGSPDACEIAWAESFAPTAALRVTAAALGPASEIWVAGSVSDEPSFGGASATEGDVLVARFDSLGQLVWSTTFVVSGEATVFDMQVDAMGKAVAVGGFEGTLEVDGETLTSAGERDAFVIQLGATGTVEWAHRFGGTGFELVRGVALTGQGGALLAGAVEGTIDFGDGPLVSDELDAFVVELTSTGEHVWSQTYGGTGAQGATGIVRDPAGALVLSGLYFEPTDFGDGPLPAPSIASGFVLKLDDVGAVQWSFGTVNATGYVRVDGGGGVHLGAGLYDVEDFGGGLLGTPGGFSLLRVVLTPNGQHVSSKAWPVSSAPYVTGFDVSAGGESWLTGMVQGSIDLGDGPLPHGGGFDAYVVRFDPTGEILFGGMYGGAETQLAAAVAIIEDGRAIITGSSAGAIDFCHDPLGSPGEPYGYLAEIVAP